MGGSKVPFNKIQPGGDIIFSDTYKSDGHVGIWLGNGKWI
ncbi:NlpC/P60 family protein [Gracilibacillus boraciitolerans]|nr:NlpC/P60 family protein [Gracilibacillus boraciitolerans]